MAKSKAIEMQGTISEILPSSMYRVELDNGEEVLATVAGRMRRLRSRILEGDPVALEVSPYDLSRGRITDRL